MLMPDHYFESLDLIPDNFFSKLGIELIICDIDNTLLRYNEKGLTDYAKRFIEKIKKSNIRILLMTNNRKKERGAPFGEKCITNAAKPFISKSKIRKMFSNIHISFNKVMFIGDQIFTDILSGKLLGAMTLLVDPLSETNNIFFAVKRTLENPIRNNFKRTKGINN